MKTEYAGIDYGMGQANIDHSSGIRYGVINQGEVSQAWADSSEPWYGKPTCPKCGNEANDPDEFGDTFIDYMTGGDLPEGYTDNHYEVANFVCVECKHFFGSQDAYGDEPISWFFEGDGYSCECSNDDGDIFIMRSPYFTYSQYCSPCAPGAGYLMNELTEPNDGNKTYCFGHEWFEPIPTKRLIKCYRCEGEGTIPANDKYGHGGKTCWVCGGTGKKAETIQKAPYTVYDVKTGEIVNP